LGNEQEPSSEPSRVHYVGVEAANTLSVGGANHSGCRVIPSHKHPSFFVSFVRICAASLEFKESAAHGNRKKAQNSGKKPGDPPQSSESVSRVKSAAPLPPHESQVHPGKPVSALVEAPLDQIFCIALYGEARRSAISGNRNRPK
jgi:hypothetical protein